MARDYAGKVKFAKLNTDENRSVSTRFRVMSIPYFALFKGGRLVDQVGGAVGRQSLETLLRKHL